MGSITEPGFVPPTVKEIQFIERERRLHRRHHTGTARARRQRLREIITVSADAVLIHQFLLELQELQELHELHELLELQELQDLQDPLEERSQRGPWAPLKPIARLYPSRLARHGLFQDRSVYWSAASEVDCGHEPSSPRGAIAARSTWTPLSVSSGAAPGRRN